MIFNKLKKINDYTKIFIFCIAFLISFLPSILLAQGGNLSVYERATQQEDNQQNILRERGDGQIRYDLLLLNQIKKSVRRRGEYSPQGYVNPMTTETRIRLREYDIVIKDLKNELKDLTDMGADDELIEVVENDLRAVLDEAERFADLVYNSGGTSRSDWQTRARIQPTEPLEVPNSEVACFRRFSIDFMCLAANISYHNVLIPSATILTWSARFFDFVLIETIVKMSEWLWPSNSESIIDIGWTIIRDFVNIVFIFVLVYISIITILKGSGETGKKVFQVVAVAILINFSLFFTKAIIDVGNLMALSVYETAITSSTGQNGSSICQEVDIGSLSCPFLAKSGVGTVFGIGNSSSSELSKKVRGNIDNIMVIKQSWMGAVLLLIMATVLFIVAFALLTRFVILVFVLLTSAAAFAGYILPKIKSEVTDKWWGALTNQLLFPIIFFILLFVSLILLDNINITESQGEGFSAVGARGDAQALFGYVLVIMLIIGSLKISRGIAGSSGDKVRGGLGKGLGLVGGGAIATAALGGRKVIGGGANKLANSIEGNNAVSRTIKSGSQRVAGSSFDIRNSQKFSKATDKLGVKTGKGGGKGGYTKSLEDKTKKINERAEMVAKPTTKEIKENAKLDKELTRAKEEQKTKEDSLTPRREELKSQDNVIAEEIRALSSDIEKANKSGVKSDDINMLANKQKLDQLEQKRSGFQSEMKSIDTELEKVRKETSDITDAIKKNLGKGKERKEQFTNQLDERVPVFKTAASRNFVKQTQQKAIQESVKPQEEKNKESLVKKLKAELDKMNKDSNKGNDESKK